MISLLGGAPWPEPLTCHRRKETLHFLYCMLVGDDAQAECFQAGGTIGTRGFGWRGFFVFAILALVPSPSPSSSLSVSPSLCLSGSLSLCLSVSPSRLCVSLSASSSLSLSLLLQKGEMLTRRAAQDSWLQRGGASLTTLYAFCFHFFWVDAPFLLAVLHRRRFCSTRLDE